MRYALAAAVLFAAVVPAWATMPMLTERPRQADLQTCQKWAASQDEDALEMWGIQESGKSSKDIGVLRLALNCLGDQPPEIVGFGSSAAADASYCKRHGRAPICRSAH